MKHILFGFLFLSIVSVSFAETQVDYIEACILVNGNNPTPGIASGSPGYAYKCPNSTAYLTVKNCGTSSNTLDPSSFTIFWNNISSTNPTFNYSDYPRAADQKGKWKVTVIYDDPIFGSHYEAYDTVEIFDYTVPKIQVWGSTTGDTLAYRHCSYDIMTFHATTGNQFVTGSYKWFINTTVPLDTTGAVVGTNTTLTTQSSVDFYATVIARDLNGCRVIDNLYAPKQNSPTAPNLGADKYKCNGTTITLNPYSPPETSYTYYWNGSTTGNSATTFPVTAPGKYWVTVDKFPSLPCKVSDTIYVYDTPAPNFTVGGDTSICYQADGPLHAKSSSALTYTWTPGTYFPGGNTGANPVIDFNGVGLGTYTISVVAKDANNCTATKTQNVTHLGQGSNPYMIATADPLNICNGTTNTRFNAVASTTYHNNNPLKYEWTPSTHLNANNINNPIVDLTGEPLNTPVNYSIKISDDKNCYIVITTSATLVPSVVANVGFSDSSLCVGNNITLLSSGTGGTGSLTYTWSPSTDLSDPAIANPVTTPTENRLYTITVSDSKGCKDNKTVDIKAIDVLVKLFATDTSGYAIEPMVLNPYANSNTYTYQWTNVTTATTLGTTKSQLAEESATYAVYATEPASGCHAADTINVTLQVGNPRLIYVPNVVNPASANADNKTVKVYGTAVLEDDFTFRIYNKWGEMIYETTSFNDANTNGWNGVYKTSNGTEQNLSVYTYSLHGKYFDGQEFDKTGSITLLR